MPPAAGSLGAELIPLVNRLQDIFCQAGLNKTLNVPLPQVAVVGSQSSGKSSVLEALVGRDFLPRGNEICTRRPLILQLVQKDAKEPNKASEYGDFLHKPGKTYTDFEAIRQEIQDETEREASGQAVTNNPIRLRIVSPHVLTMTLVDLPGLTKVPVGNQPSNIEEQIRDMAMSFIKHETCLILAVSPANTDLANSDALMMARSVDPQGHRTIGVITKLDIMDRGTDACAYLRGDVVPLRLGYIGVVNRSQADIKARHDMKFAQAAEAEFFRTHPEYKELASRCGIHTLAHSISRLLTAHIQKMLPKLRKQVDGKLKETTVKLAKLGSGAPEGTAAQGSLVLQLLNKFATAVDDLVAGRASHDVTKEIVGGARVRYIFQEIFARSLDELDPCTALTDGDIHTAIENAGGTKGVLLLPEAPFELLLKSAIAKLHEPCAQCLNLVHAELQQMVEVSLRSELEAFPNLAATVNEYTNGFMTDALNPAEQMIRSLVDCHLSYINMSHPQFVGATEALRLADQYIRESNGETVNPTNASPADTTNNNNSNSNNYPATPSGFPATPAAGGEPGDSKAGMAALLEGEGGKAGRGGQGLLGFLRRNKQKEEGSGRRGGGLGAGVRASFSMGSDGNLTLLEPPSSLPLTDTHSDAHTLQITTTRVLLSSYYEVVRGSLQDMVPKAIMHFLVNTLSAGIEQHLIRLMFREEFFAELLAEPGELAKKRQRAQQTITALKAALEALDQMASTVSSSSRGSSSSSSRYSLGTGKENSVGEPNRSPSRRQSALPSKPLPAAFTSGRGSLASSFD